MDGLTPNQKALFLAQEQKAAEANRVLDENRNLRAQLEAAQQARYGAVQANPLADLVGELQQQSQFDVNSRAALFALSAQAANAAENWLTSEMVKAKVPAEKWDAVADLVRQSGYKRPVRDALALSSGTDVPDLQRQLEAERQRVAALQKALDGRTAAGGNPPGNPALTTPAAVAADMSEPVTMEEYQKLPKELRDKARIRR